MEGGREGGMEGMREVCYNYNFCKPYSLHGHYKV